MPSGKNTLGVVIVGVVAIMTAFAGASVLDSYGVQTHTVDQSVDTDSEWNSGTLSNLDVANSSIQLAGTNTTGTYTSPDYDYNETRLSNLKVYTEVANTTNSSVTATVTVYDSTDTAVDSVSKTFTDSGSADISSLGNLTSGDYYDVEVQIDRDSGSVTSPTVDKYTTNKKSYNTGLTTLAILVVVMAGVGAVVNRGF